MIPATVCAPADALLFDALLAIVNEVAGPDRPYSTDSWLPLHLVEAAQAAISSATQTQTAAIAGTPGAIQ